MSFFRFGEYCFESYVQRLIVNTNTEKNSLDISEVM